MRPIEIVQVGSMSFAELQAAVFVAALEVARDAERRSDVSHVYAALVAPVAKALISYSQAAGASGERPTSLPKEWVVKLDPLVADLVAVFFEQREGGVPALEEAILQLAERQGVQNLQLPPFPLGKVPAGLDALLEPLE